MPSASSSNWMFLTFLNAEDITAKDSSMLEGGLSLLDVGRLRDRDNYRAGQTALGQSRPQKNVVDACKISHLYSCCETDAAVCLLAVLAICLV